MIYRSSHALANALLALPDKAIASPDPHTVSFREPTIKQASYCIEYKAGRIMMRNCDYAIFIQGYYDEFDDYLEKAFNEHTPTTP